MVSSVEVKVVYSGGRASDGMLDLYDAGVSIYGVARVLAITTHAFINNGEIRQRAEAVRGANMYICAPRYGSYEEVIKIIFSNDVIHGIGLSIFSSAFWDFLKWSINISVGNEAEPSTPFVRRFLQRYDSLNNELPKVLETPMESLQRPIKNENDIVINIRRPRVGDIVHLDNDTLGYVTILNDSDPIRGLVGNVTKYNILSGIGRFFDDIENRTIPFDLDSSIDADEKRLLTWSMDQRSQGYDGKIIIDVIKIINVRLELKRYKVIKVRRIN
ncbi:MAG: hypothetical protein HGB14_04125 [Anaerolineaceae bacterium]|nr:hypothetical protein [Anaerolineaceae bacterium]